MSFRYHGEVIANAATGTTDAEAYAVGTRDGIDVVKTDKTYRNNAKYYASLLGASAKDAAASAEAASNAQTLAEAAQEAAELAENNAEGHAQQSMQSIHSAQAYAAEAAGHATTASNNATAASEQAELARQEAEKAKSYSEVAEAVTNITIAGPTKLGLIKGGDNHISEDGTLTLIKETADKALVNSYAGRIKVNKICGGVHQKKYTGKNTILYPHDVTYPYTNFAVTFDYDEETSFITANGTAASTAADYEVLNVQNRNETGQVYLLPVGRYILTGCPSGGSTDTYRLIAGCTTVEGTYGQYAVDIGEGAEFEVVDATRPTQIQIAIQNGYTANNLVFKPMVRRIDIADDTFEPYVGGIASPNPEFSQEIQNVEISEIKTHNKNQIPFPYYETSHEDNGIDWAVVTLNGTITANGAATSDSDFLILLGSVKTMTAEPDTYILSGCPTGGSNSSYALRVGKKVDDGYAFIGQDIGEGFEFTLTDKTELYFYIRIFNGTTVENLTFKPLLRKASVEDNGFTVAKSSTATVSFALRAIEVTENDDYTYSKDGKYYIADTIELIDDVYYKIQRIYRHVVEACSSYTEPRAFIKLPYAMKMYTVQSGIFSMCNRFTAVKHTSLVNSTDNSCGGQGDTFAFRADSLGLTSVEEWSTWFAANETIIDYVLATPVVTQLSEDEVKSLYKLKSYNTVTYLSTDSTLDALIDVEYGTSKVGAYTLDTRNKVEILMLSATQGEECEVQLSDNTDYVPLDI